MFHVLKRYHPEGKEVLQSEDAVRAVQDMLRTLGFIAKRRQGDQIVGFGLIEEDGEYGPLTESAVLDFQKSEGLTRDGEVGPETMAALEEALTARLLELNLPGVDFTHGNPTRPFFTRVPGGRTPEPESGGYAQIALRNDVALKFLKVYEEAKRRGATWAFSQGMRNLRARVNSANSPVSLHYLGRALNLYIFSGMSDPERDHYLIVRDEKREEEEKTNPENRRYYRVYARCRAESAEGGEAPPESELSGVIFYQDIKTKHTLRGRFLDLTELFGKSGFRPVRSLPHFEQGGSIMGARWWHFRYTDGLVDEVTTYGQELLKLYSRETLRDSEPWKHRDRVWGVNWF